MKTVNLLLVIAVLGFMATNLYAVDGKELFARHCSGCHYEGGNSVNRSKPLHRLFRHANGLRTVDDLVNKIRRGGQGMPAYRPDRISDPEARAIAEYIIKTFD